MTRRVFTSIFLGALYLCSHLAFAADTPAPTKVACIGDSITFGSGIEDRNKNSFPAQLGAMLGENYTVSNFGVSASTLLKKGNKPYWNLKQFKTAQDFQPNIVIIKLGTNDTKPGNWKHKSEFKSNYIEMVKIFQGLESKPAVWICYPVPVFPERWGINDKAVREELIPLVDKVAKETGAKVINLYKPLKGRAELVPDKVHPNSEGAKLIAQTIAKAITGKAAQAERQSNTDSPWPGKASSFHSFSQYDFTIENMKCKVVVPEVIAEGKPWIWRARFFGHEPQTDIALLKKGFHVAYVDVSGLYGAPKAVARWDSFYKYLTESHGFSKKVTLEGMSRGGLIIFNWAAKNPEKVHSIYADAPVCDFKSWPGINRPSRAILVAYGLTKEQAAAYKGNPVDNLKSLAEAGVPLLHVVGDADKVVPIAENTSVIEKRYKELGGQITVIHKKNIGHHPHSLKDPKPIVDFILKHAQSGSQM